MSRLASGVSHLLGLAVASSVVTAVLPGCTGDEAVSPVDGAGGSSASTGSTSASSGASSGSASQSSSSTGGGPVLRTIVSRNPFGEQAGNLLADGDFDLSFGFAGQQGWTAYANQQIPLVAETGGLCKSGLRCARVAPGVALLARGTSAPDGREMTATLWAKRTGGTSCQGVYAVAIGCDSFFLRGGALTASVLGEDEDGWCAFSGTVPGSEIATCLYVENDSDQPLLLDAATLTAAPPGDEARPAPAPIPPLSPARRARMERVRDVVRDTLPFGSPPKKPPRPGQLAD